ncbi:MAG TPA: biotin--[acetyl-CoA-carboxylase] ligase [Candidatus Limnocylindrales bacterium]|nr:biotin--[acetyl-CoA-carboxylase] ligase [Candidatus Limnocylindrales bacterium]
MTVTRADRDELPTADISATTPAIRRQERFRAVGSTNDVVREWLADGEPEICLAVADEQTAGRGRSGRTWTAPPGAGLLLSLGFRPSWLAPDRVWRLAATVSLAMADAAEEVAGLPDRAVHLKWPNDLVVVVDAVGHALDGIAARGSSGTSVRKIGGVLGETDGLGTTDPRAVVGMGLNADWAADDFPAELAGAMSSLRSASGNRPIDLGLLLDAFTSRLETRIEALHGGRFDVADWIDRQVTTGREIDLVDPAGASHRVAARGVDPVSGALRVADPSAPAGERLVLVGEIRHVRLGEV